MNIRSFLTASAALLATQLLFTPSAFALVVTWAGTPAVPSNWDIGSNWNGGAVPTSATSDEAQILNGGVAVISSGMALSTGSVTLGNSTTATSGNVIMSGGSLTFTTSDLRIGGNGTAGGGTAVFDLSGGDIIMNAGNLNVGMGPTGNGTLNISGGSLSVYANSIAAIGNRGTAAVNQTAGTLYVRGNSGATATGFAAAMVQLGRNITTGTGSGTYTLSGGTLASTNLRFGQAVGIAGSTNTFNLQGTGELIVKEINILNTAATNTFNFTGGTLRAQLIGVPLNNTGGVFAPSLALFNGIGDISQLAIDPVTTATFAGNFGYTQSGSGRLTLDLRDAFQYDIVDVGGSGTGAVTLGGLVEVNPLSGFDPGLGTLFDVVKADTLSFSAQILGQTPSGNIFEPSVIAGGDGRQVLRLTVVPEPGTAALFGFAALSLAFRRQNRRGHGSHRGSL